MTTAFQHRPYSAFLVDAGAGPKPQTSESQEAGADAKNPELPEKYRGKTAAEIAEMHMNAEKRLGQLQNEVGTYRGLVRDLSALRPEPAASRTDPEPLNVSGDDVLADPVGTVRRIVQHSQPKDPAPAEPAVDPLAQTDLVVERQRLDYDFPNVVEITSSPEFQDFVSRTESRQLDLQTAATGEGLEQVRAARRLLEDYQDFRSLAPKKTDPAVEAARRVTTEGAPAHQPVTTGETYTQDQIVEMIQKDPARWRSPSTQAEILKAIREGRYVRSS